MYHADGNVGGLIFRQQEGVGAACDFGGSLDDHPVLGAVVVFLQAQRRAGPDGNTLDLETLADIDAVVPAPGARHLAVVRGLRGFQPFEFRHYRFHLLGVASRNDQQRVRRVNDEQVIRSQRHHRPVWRMDVGFAGLQRHALAADAVASLVRRRQVRDGVPAADIAPRAAERNDRDIGMVLHDGVVDAFGAARLKSGGVGTNEGRVLRGFRHCFAAIGQNIGRVLLQRVEQRGGAAQKNAGVPQHAAPQDQGLGSHGVGLFDKADDGMACVVAKRALFDVAESRAGKAGNHAEGDDGAALSRRPALLHYGCKGSAVRNMVVSRTEQQQIVGFRAQRRQRHGRRRIATARLQDDAPLRARGFQRIDDQKTVVFSGYADYLGSGNARIHLGNTLQREQQQALAVDQRYELLGEAFARQRPQARAGAATQDDGNDESGLRLGGLIVHIEEAAWALRRLACWEVTWVVGRVRAGR